MDTEKRFEWVARCIVCGDPFYLSQKEIRHALATQFGAQFIVCSGCLNSPMGEGIWTPDLTDLRMTVIYRADVSNNVLYMVKQRLGVPHRKGEALKDIFYLPNTWHRFKK